MFAPLVSISPFIHASLGTQKFSSPEQTLPLEDSNRVNIFNVKDTLNFAIERS